MEEQKPIDLSQYAENVVSFENSVVARARAAADKEAQAVLEMAELKAKNSRRLSEVRLAEARKTRQSTKYREQKEIHAQVGLAIEEALRQFVLELAGLSFVAVGQLHDRDAVSRRKDQLSIFQTTMSFITALIRMQESLEEKYNLKKADVKEGRGDNVKLLRDANRLMKTASK